MIKFAKQFVDPALAVDLQWDYEAWSQQWAERLFGEFCAAQSAARIPRRLGGEATADQLADDKFLLKRITHALRKASVKRDSAYLDLYGHAPAVLSGDSLSECTRAGAARDWPAWLVGFAEEVVNARRISATHMCGIAVLHPDAGAEAQRWCALLADIERLI